MPILPPSTSVPYDSVEYVLRVLRVICNDMGLTINGVLLADNIPVVLPLINMAYRTLQEDLTLNGVETQVKQAILTGIAPVPSTITDPAVQVWIGYDSYFDGLNLNAAPLLPQDMVGPLRLWERRSGFNAVFNPMLPAHDGLPTGPRGSVFRLWDMREDGRIYLKGANQLNDLQLRYNQYLPELVTVNDPVRILRSDRAIAYQAAVIFAEGRGSALVPSFEAKYEKYLNRMTGRTARRKQRRTYSRRGNSAGAHNGWGY